MLRLDPSLATTLAGGPPPRFQFKHYIHGTGPFAFKSPV
jgi:hypothetical protein